MSHIQYIHQIQCEHEHGHGNDEVVNSNFIEMKEEYRLALIVKTITDECAMVPRGAISKRVDGLNVINPVFQGLKFTVATDLNNYQLYRSPQNDWNENLLTRPYYDYATDFLDTLDAVAPPQHSNAVIVDEYDAMVFIKSLLWPGMLFFHKCDTSLHGFVYFGNGRKNSELLFMI